jgi:NAD(P)-dependent dehydrogenase (short-subunit alcohol dehydrogenase family)
MGVVLITGCSSGFGLETALAFARNGDTAVATMRNLGKAAALRERAADGGLEIQIEQLDVTDDASIEAGVAATIERHGTVDVLVNNAGLGHRAPVETMSIDTAMRVMDTNFWGAMRMVRAVLPVMRERRSGVIVNVSSIASRLPALPYNTMYAASKSALDASSEALSGELAPYGIRVVSIEPGFFATEVTANTPTRNERVSDAYAADVAWFQSFADASVSSGADPVRVADVIVAAVTDPETPLHLPVGDDAAMYLEMFRGVDSYEGWVYGVVIPTFEQTIGPRPTLD